MPENCNWVKVGQVWRDYDKRFRNIPRFVRVVERDEQYAYCVASAYPDAPSGRKVRIRLDRLRPNSTGYKLERE